MLVIWEFLFQATKRKIGKMSNVVCKVSKGLPLNDKLLPEITQPTQSTKTRGHYLRLADRFPTKLMRFHGRTQLSSATRIKLKIAGVSLPGPVTCQPERPIVATWVCVSYLKL